MAKSPSRPVFLSFLRIHLPVTALVSFAHRVAGVLLALLIPLLLYLLQLSLRDAAGFAQVRQMLHGNTARVALIIVLWALLHHLFAGVRFLLIDMGFGVLKTIARQSAIAVAVSALLITLLIATLVL